MYWVGKENSADRVKCSKVTAPVQQGRWITPKHLPVVPYEPPKGSMEAAERLLAIGMGIAIIVVAYTFFIIANMPCAH